MMRVTERQYYNFSERNVCKLKAPRRLPASGFWLLASVFLFVSCGHQQSSDSAKSRITTASGVRVRSEPAESAGEIARLPLGTVVRELGRTPEKGRAGSLEDYWYRVATTDGKEGWVFGGLAAPFDVSDRDRIYLKIASDRLSVKDAAFADLVDLYSFLSTAAGEVKDRGVQGEIELARLLALKRAVEEIPPEKQEEPQYASWIKSQEEDLVYNEPAGQWIVIPDLFWDLQKKYADLPLAERIAWEAANNPLPGECEGYFPCYLAFFNRTKGRYLELYPGGSHAEEAINEMVESLDDIRALRETASPPDQEERGEARKELNKLRETVAKTSGNRKADLLKHVDDYLKYYG
jgi:hypothetical protein